MGRIVYRGAFATFPVVGLTPGDLAYATDILILYEWSGVAWAVYSDYPDYEGGKSKLFTAADWAALEATDINFLTFAGALAFGAVTLLLYNVPAGRRLYITDISFTCTASVVANADNNQMGRVLLGDNTLGVIYVDRGGNGGGHAAFKRPIEIPGGNQMSLSGENRANHNCMMVVVALGYQV